MGRQDTLLERGPLFVGAVGGLHRLGGPLEHRLWAVWRNFPGTQGVHPITAQLGLLRTGDNQNEKETQNM